MTTKAYLIAAALMAGVWANAGAAHAHASLAASVPAQGATVAAPRTVVLTFDAPMPTATTAAGIVMTAMPGVENHGEMVIRNFTSAWSDDSRTLTLSLRQPLRAGTYEVRWESAKDGHRVKGSVGFDVR